jgi:toxin CcdB
MAQFQVYSNMNNSTKTQYPFLLDVQNRILDSLDTRLVIPISLFSNFHNKPITKLTPIIQINGVEYIILTSQMAGIQKKMLGSFVCDVSEQRQEILDALDFLIVGF